MNRLHALPDFDRASISEICAPVSADWRGPPRDSICLSVWEEWWCRDQAPAAPAPPAETDPRLARARLRLARARLRLAETPVAAAVLALVSARYGIGVDVLVGRDRAVALVRPRRIAIAAIASATPLSLTGISAIFTARHHSSILAARDNALRCDHLEVAEVLAALPPAACALEAAA